MKFKALKDVSVPKLGLGLNRGEVVSVRKKDEVELLKGNPNFREVRTRR